MSAVYEYVRCAVCSGTMRSRWDRKREAAIHRGCLPKHGRDRTYKLGCRCDECKAFAVERVTEYNQRYRAAHGVLPSTASRARRGLVRPAPWIPHSERLALYERDGNMCALCDEPVRRDVGVNDDLAPSLDHIVPRSQGGTHDHDNLRTVHRICNARRGTRAA